MAGLASLFASLLIALAIQHKLWDDPREDEPLVVQVSLLGLLLALAISITVVASAAMQGHTKLTHWETVLTSMTLGGGLLFLIGPALFARLGLLGATVEPKLPERLRPVARTLWTWGLVIVVIVGLTVSVLTA